MSSGSSGCNSVKVTVNVDLRGTISSEICPEHEIIIGFLPMPTATTSWDEMDQQIAVLFDVSVPSVQFDSPMLRITSAASTEIVTSACIIMRVSSATR